MPIPPPVPLVPGLSAAPGSVPLQATSVHAGHSTAALPPEMLDAVMPAPAAGMDTAMFAAHAVATLVTALLLARGELALAPLASLFRPLVRTQEPVAIAPARVPGPCTATITIPADRAGRRLPTRRGPPAMVFAA